MNKLRTFFYVFWKTFTSMEYYGEILKAPLSFSLKFFGVYFLFYAVVVTGVVTYIVLLPLGDFLTSSLPGKLMQIYPEELEVSLKDGAVSTNMSEPYFVSMSKLDLLKQGLNNEVFGVNNQRITNFLVIDTNAKVEDFIQYQTLILLTKHHLSIRNNSGNIETISLSDADNLVINKRNVGIWINSVTPYLDYVVPIMIVVFFVGVVLFVPIGRLIYGLFLGWMLMLVSRMLTKSLSYKKAYQIGLHFMVISTTFFSLWKLLGVSLDFLFVETILLGILGVVVIRSLVSGLEVRS